MTTQESEIVDASEEDIESLIELLREYLPEQCKLDASFQIVDDWETECRKSLKKLFSNENYFIRFLKLSDENIGFITFGINVAPLFIKSKQGYISDIFIVKRYRRRGFGKKLALNAIESLKGKGVDNIQLNTIKVNEETMNFWEALGFETYMYRMKKEV